MNILISGLKSTNTTMAGGILIALAILNAIQAVMDGGLEAVDLNVVTAQVVAGIGLILSRDSHKSSEQVGTYLRK